MTRILCELDYITLKNDFGKSIDSVKVTCGKCQHSEESFGDTKRSINRCLRLLHDGCTCGNFFYYVDDTKM